MTAIADSKRRVIMPGERPIDVFSCQDECNAHFLLGRLTKPAPPKKKPASKWLTLQFPDRRSGAPVSNRTTSLLDEMVTSL